MSAFGPKRTSPVAPHMSAFGGKADMKWVYYAPHNAGAARRYPGDRGPGGIWNDGPHACRLGQSCNCRPDAYVAIRCEGTPYGPRCWWNNNCYCEPPRG